MFPVTILPHNVRYLTFKAFPQAMLRRLFFFPRGAVVRWTTLCVSREAPTEAERRLIDSHKVRVEFPLDGLDTASLRGKATYEQIQAYVEEKTGLKVSSLYISQVKRKCGLEVGESFNKAKSDDARVPVCPPEKETAILEALKHFGMI